MDLYELGKLKGQKLNLSALTSKPQFKQQYLAPIRCLPESDQLSILKKVKDKVITILEVKKMAGDLKGMNALKTAFVKLTNCESWKHAEESFPSYATESQLKRFIGYSLRMGVPTSFQDYCKRAKLSTEISNHEEDHVYMFSSKEGTEHFVVFVCSHLTNVSGQMIQTLYHAFSGIDLAVVNVGLEVRMIKVTGKN